MEMNLLKNSKVCKINIEKSSLAKTLEKVYGIEWGFSQETPLDSYHHLRACLTKDISYRAWRGITCADWYVLTIN